MVEARAGQKGADLEETLKAYFWQSGYFAVRSVPFRLDDEDVTDVDVWLYERPAAFSRRRLIVDAKNKTRPKAAERLIWVRGLQSALAVDGAIVASTDRRQSSRQLAKAMGVTLLDGEALSKLAANARFKTQEQFASEDYDGMFKAVDVSRRDNQWRTALLAARSSLLTSFGIHSVNTSLRAAGYFGEQAIMAAPASDQAQIALRGFYSACAYAAIGLDYVLADLSFRSQEDRRSALVNGIRYGHVGSAEALSTVRAAVGLVRQYAQNGSSVAKQVERGFEAQAANISAETIADYVARVSASDFLYVVARELENNAYKFDLLHFDALSVDARSWLGVLLDFHGLSRERLAKAGRSAAAVPAPTLSISSTDEAGTLFPDHLPKPKT